MRERTSIHHTTKPVRTRTTSRTLVALLASALAVGAGAAAAAGAHAQEVRLGSAASHDGTITFLVHGLRSDRGLVRGALYDREDRWAHEGADVASCRARIHHGRARCSMVAPGPGRYGFAFMHDEDADGDFDRDLFGIPQEGYGFSNDVRPNLAMPSFRDVSFEVGDHASVAQRIVARYGI